MDRVNHPPSTEPATDLSVVPINVAEFSQAEVKRSYPPEVWEAVRADFRAGLSYSKLSETYGIPINTILTRRKREGWRRDLRQDVRVETFSRLAAGDEPGSSRDDDEALVSSAANRAAAVVARQRRVTGLGIDVCERGLHHAKAELEAAIARNAGAKELAAITSRVLYFANALARVVPLERRAYGLDDESAGEESYEDRLRKWWAARGGASR